MILDKNGNPIGQKLVSGKLAVRMMVEEIGLEIGQKRLREFEGKVRADLVKEHGGTRGRSADDWIQAMARVIVADDDKRADAGFRRGIRRIRRAAGEPS